MSDNIVPFGKYKGQPVEVMLADASYCEWALAQPGIRERYPTFVTIVVNGGSALDAPTPEHNKMQLLFRDPETRVAVFFAVFGHEHIDKKATTYLWKHNASVLAAGNAAQEAETAKAAKKIEALKREISEPIAPEWSPTIYGTPERDANDALFHQYYAASNERNKKIDVAKEEGLAGGKEAYKVAASHKLHEMQESGEAWALIRKEIGGQRVVFEDGGWDAVLGGPLWIDEYPSLWIELKPQMGDDYPAVLRTLKLRRAHGHRVLIVDRFEAEGAGLDDVKWIFQQSGIIVKTLAEIRAAAPKTL